MGGFILKVSSSEISCSVSHMLTLTWGIDMFEKLTPETGVNLKSTLCIMLLGVEISCKKPVFFFNIFSGDPDFDALIIGLC